MKFQAILDVLNFVTNEQPVGNEPSTKYMHHDQGKYYQLIK